MKVARAEAVEFLLEIGFVDAPIWDDEKIKSRISRVPEKVGKEDVPEGFSYFYAALCESKGEAIELVDEPFEKPKPKEKTAPPAKDERLSAQYEEKEDMPGGKNDPLETVERKLPKTKPTPSEGGVRLDAYGNRVASIAAKVNKVLGEEWEEEALIAKRAGVKVRQARNRLYHAKEDGVIECRRLVQYRLVKKGDNTE